MNLSKAPFGRRRLTVSGREEPVFPNTAHVAQREYLELVRSRLFHVSTITLTVLAVFVALLPVVARVSERGATTKIAIVSSDSRLADRTKQSLDGLLNNQGDKFTLLLVADAASATSGVDDHVYDA